MAITAAYSQLLTASVGHTSTGIFVKHQLLSHKYRRNMLSSYRTLFITLATCCLFSGSLATSTTTATLAAASKRTSVSSATPAPYECGSMDIRNQCDNLAYLENCTVITGYLIIALLPSNGTCDYTKYRFPKLREITSYLLLNAVKNLTTIKYIFPNLTVIRGLSLFHNYAMGINNMNELATVEFPSLVAIQRGHVFIGSNPKLCFLNMINFERLTLTAGVNHIFPVEEATCPSKPKCLGCPSGYCWSNMVCQKFENDNIINYKQGIEHCDAQCLGGCYNRTAQGCAVCRSWSNHGTCVEKCPADKYACEQYVRCYTREECIDKKLFIHKTNCVSSCPGGYKLNIATQECDSCGGVNDCPRLCNIPKDPFLIYNLADVETLKGCEILNGTVVFNLRSPINEKDLEHNLGDVKDIMGHLKVYKSNYLTSLSFFKNLQRIHGMPMENQQYSLVLYNNRNLRELWSVQKSFELINGGMYIHANDRLCNRLIRSFKSATKHDYALDSIQTNDQEVLCSPAKLNLGIEVLSHRALKLSWLKDQTAEEVEIIYKPIPAGEEFVEHSELDTRVCQRINWQRDLKFASELEQNATHYIYTIDELEAHTKYACLVKTFGREEIHEARSEVKLVTTQIDIPPPPAIKIYKKSSNSLAVQLYYVNREDELVDFYRLEVYEISDKKDLLDQRDYCEDPMKTYSDYHNEDYDDCCSRRLEESEDDLFKQQLKKEFACSLDHKEYCESNSADNNYTDNSTALLLKRLEHSETNYTIRSLKRYQLYSVQVQACNHAGCGSFNAVNERTNYSLAGQMYDLTACKMANNNEYRLHFKEPEKPNGYITSYALHFRYFDSSSTGPYRSQMRCLTRLEHERNNYMYMGHLNSTFNQAAVRVESFGRHTFTDWVDITPCSGVQPTTKLAGRSSHSWNVFFIFFAIGAGGTVLWICYKRKYWRKLPHLRRYVPLRLRWNAFRPDGGDTDEDRQILVDGFESVRFHNSPDEDMKYLVR